MWGDEIDSVLMSLQQYNLLPISQSECHCNGTNDSAQMWLHDYNLLCHCATVRV